jgi:hypothetical protein
MDKKGKNLSKKIKRIGLSYVEGCVCIDNE